MRVLVLALFVGVGVVCPARAEPPVEQAVATPSQIRDISDLLAPIIDKHKIPAMVAVVVKGDAIAMQGVVGVRHAGSEDKATLDDLWHLGSCTKSITATMCAVLVEQGKLKWESTLAEVFPELAGKMHEDFKGVTLQQLLTNRGGVPADLNFDGLWGKLWKFKGTPTEARHFLMESVVTRAPDYTPGTKNVYANGSFAIAGHMAEQAAGKPYEELMQELLFAPLKMTSCGWGAPGTWASESKDQPWGHGKDGKGIKPKANTSDGSGGGSDNPIAISPAGRLHCTIGDWAKYVSLHLRGDALNPKRECRVISAASFDRLHTPPDGLSDYCYGWGRPERAWAGPEGKRFVLTHNGSNTMWFCVTWIAPSKDFAVLVCCNTGIDAAGKACDEACARLIGEVTKTESTNEPQHK